MQTFFQQSHQQVNRDGNPDLGAHGVFGSAIEGLDAQMLFEPFKEQLDLPPTMIELSDGQGRFAEVVGQEDQGLARLGVPKANPSQRVRVVAVGVEIDQHDCLIQAQAGGFIHWAGISTSAAKSFLGSGDEESTAVVQAIQSVKVQIAAIENVERSGLIYQLVEEVDIMDATGRNDNDSGIVSAQCEQGMQFDGRGVPMELGPGEQGQTQVDGSGVQRISSGLLEFGPEGFISIKGVSLSDQDLGEISEDSPVALLVGVSERAAGCWFANAAVIQLGSERTQTSFDIAQAFAECQLGKCHHEELFVGWQSADAEVGAIPLNTLVKFVFRQTVEQLGKDGATFVHRVIDPQ